MRTVAQETFDVLRASGVTTVFGNPGSNELPFLAQMPEDFSFVLGLHEGVVVSMADGWAQASGRVALANLHAAAGTGNGLGVVTNAANAHSPIVMLAGQQVRAQLGVGALLANRDAPSLTVPLTKWSGEPITVGDTVRMVAQAVYTAGLPPQGPVYVSVPLDDWGQEAGRETVHLASRTVSAAGDLGEAALAHLVGTLEAAQNPVLIFGGGVDVPGAYESGVSLAEALRAPVWIAPSPGRCPFPTRHPSFRGTLPASISAISRLLDGHDVALVVGAPVFRYHQYEPGKLLPSGVSLLHLTDDGEEAARAPMGDAVVCDVRAALAALADRVTEADRPALAPRAIPAASDFEDDLVAPFAVDTVLHDIGLALPEGGIVVKESTSTTSIVWDHLDLKLPGSYFFPAAGGLGWGMGAALGVQLARPDRRVIAVIGDGSANYAITALWTAVQYRLPVVFVILRNGSYAALRSFVGQLGVAETPGLDLPGIDFVQIGRGYGVNSFRAGTRVELQHLLATAIASTEPTLIEVGTRFLDPFARTP